jgi:two-component system phosphate regulon response regulator PhoB
MSTSSAASAASAGLRVLVVEDEPDISALVAYHLAKAGYRVVTAATGPEATEAAYAQQPALVVLDLMLPGMSGFEVLEQLRASEATKHVAVLMLTARREESDRIRGLSLGADDYLTKPFSPQELVLRVGAILRRVQAPRPLDPHGADLLEIGTIQIDQTAFSVAVDGRPVDLTPMEYRLLLLLAERRGRVQGRRQLLEAVWDAAPDLQTRTVDMHVQRLRAKLGAAGELIETVRGFGYRLRAAERSRAG